MSLSFEEYLTRASQNDSTLSFINDNHYICVFDGEGRPIALQEGLKFGQNIGLSCFRTTTILSGAIIERGHVYYKCQFEFTDETGEPFYEFS